MSVKELTREQSEELKGNYYCWVLHEDEDVSYGELAMIDELVSDEEVFEYYEGTCFCNDDFFCSAHVDEEFLVTANA